AGWAPGQLETEIQHNGWLHCSADPELIFGQDTSGKYEKALKKIGIALGMLSSEAGQAERSRRGRRIGLPADLALALAPSRLRARMRAVRITTGGFVCGARARSLHARHRPAAAPWRRPRSSVRRSDGPAHTRSRAERARPRPNRFRPPRPQLPCRDRARAR